jgi:hypothetical protein
MQKSLFVFERSRENTITPLAIKGLSVEKIVVLKIRT